MSLDIDSATEWPGDLLGRKPNGIFLHNLVRQRMKSAQVEANALCFALDSDWGTGKTFFLKRWAADLRSCQHPVIEFDAWANDLSEEPLIGFMAELKSGLEPLIKKVPPANKAQATAKKKMGQIIDQGRKAVLPAASLVLKSYLSKKFDIEGMINLVRSPEDVTIDLEAAEEALGKGLNDLFENALKSHDETKKAVHDFKAGVADLLQYLSAHGTALPLFVIIDELDRCRPDYAIRLLEGIKHLFDAPGICFVVSTNLLQMQESVKAVYGGGFDGYQYLKRFFAFEYKLPSPSRSTYCLTLVEQHPALLALGIASGLPSSLTQEKTAMELMALHLEMMGNAFNLSLRSLKQIAFISEAALAGISGKKVFPLYLLMLAAVLHRSPALFDELQRGVGRDQFIKILKDAGFNELELRFKAFMNGQIEERGVGLSVALQNYYLWAREDLKNLREMVSGNLRERTYPDSLLLTVIEEMPSSYQPDASYPPSLRHYAGLLKTAGYLHQ